MLKESASLGGGQGKSWQIASWWLNSNNHPHLTEISTVQVLAGEHWALGFALHICFRFLHVCPQFGLAANDIDFVWESSVSALKAKRLRWTTRTSVQQSTTHSKPCWVVQIGTLGIETCWHCQWWIAGFGPWRRLFPLRTAASVLLLQSQWRPKIFSWAMEKNRDWFGYIGDYTTQLYRDFNKPL